MGELQGIDFAIGAIAPSIPHLEPPLSKNDLKLANRA